MNPSPPRDLVITAAKASSPHFERCDKARGDTFSACAECRAAFDTAHYALAAVLPAAYRLLAERIALVSDIRIGFRCPACHGCPSSRKLSRFSCGCGYSWEVRDVQYSARAVNIPVMLQEVAKSGELPAIPEKITQAVSGD